MPQYVMVRLVEVSDELAETIAEWDDTWMVKDQGSKDGVTPDQYDRVDVAGAIVLAAQGQAAAAAAVLRDEQTREVAAAHHPQKVS